MFLFHFLFFIEYEENKKVSKKAAVSLPLPFCHTNEIFIKTASHTNAHKSRLSRAVPYVCLPPQFHSPSAPESALHSGLWTAGAQSRRLSCLSPEVPKISGRLFRFRYRALRLPRRKSGSAGFLRNTRAMESRCFWPPESFTPRWPISVS